mgnify:FL=1
MNKWLKRLSNWFFQIENEVMIPFVLVGILVIGSFSVISYYNGYTMQKNSEMELADTLFEDVNRDLHFLEKRLPEEAVLVFVTAPSFDVIRKRLVHRGDVAPGLMEERLERARWECSQAENYDYIVINDDLQKASEEICAIMLAEKCKTMERIHLIKEELTCSTPQ